MASGSISNVRSHSELFVWTTGDAKELEFPPLIVNGWVRPPNCGPCTRMVVSLVWWKFTGIVEPSVAPSPPHMRLSFMPEPLINNIREAIGKGLSADNYRTALLATGEQAVPVDVSAVFLYGTNYGNYYEVPIDPGNRARFMSIVLNAYDLATGLDGGLKVGLNYGLQVGWLGCSKCQSGAGPCKVEQ